MRTLRRVGAVLFWAFVVLAISGQLAGASELAGAPDMPSPGDGMPGLDTPWEPYGLGALIALALIWFLG